MNRNDKDPTSDTPPQVNETAPFPWSMREPLPPDVSVTTSPVDRWPSWAAAFVALIRTDAVCYPG